MTRLPFLIIVAIHKTLSAASFHLHPPTSHSRGRTALFSTAPSIPRMSPADIASLTDTDLNLVVVPNFIDDDLVGQLRRDVLSLRKKGKFKSAKTGEGATNALDEDVRIAETCFVGPSKLGDVRNDARATLYDILDGIRVDLSGRSDGAVLDSNLSESLYAYYPQGGFYRRHRDAIPNTTSVLRCWSLLLYLNDEWEAEDGGKLRIHRDSGGDFLAEGESPDYVDVEPRGGTLVLFRSDRMPHEVLDTKAERMAVVGWYNRAPTVSDVGLMSSGSGQEVRIMMLAAAGFLVISGVASILL